MRLSIIILTLSTTLLFTACGGGATADRGTVATTSTLDTTNYVAVAKTLYAQQDGKQTRGSISTRELKAPNAQLAKDTLYLSKVLKPRGHKVEKMEVLYNDKKLTVDVDSSFKYATISYDGKSSKVNFREFTTN
jgi:hypothetical protein